MQGTGGTRAWSESIGGARGSSIIKNIVQTIRVETPSAKYDVFAGSGLLAELAPRIERAVKRLPRRVFVVTSPEIWALWGKKFLRSFHEARAHQANPQANFEGPVS